MTVISINPKDIKVVHVLRTALDWNEDDLYEHLRKEYGLCNLNDLGVLGIDRLKKELRAKATHYNKLKDQRRKQIIAICYEKRLFLTDESFDVAKLDNWLLSPKSKHQKKFNSLSYDQLKEVSFQLKCFGK